VVVTANRREENVLTVPYNYQRDFGREIEESGVKDLQD